jgi:DNA polymerase I-like protein with 3'-5' exonuclease and polymerase domains
MERQAINFVVQASASDLMKMTIERISQNLEKIFPIDLKSNFVCVELVSLMCKECDVLLVRPTSIRPVYLIMQIYDELLFEIEQTSRFEEIIQLIRHDMQHVDSISLPLPVKVQSGDTWDLLSPVI